VVVHTIHTEGRCFHTTAEAAGTFLPNSYFLGAQQRKAMYEGRGDFVPIFLSEIPLLFKSGTVPLDVSFVSVSPPDSHGFCSLGPSIDVSLAAVNHSKIVVAQVPLLSSSFFFLLLSSCFLLFPLLSILLCLALILLIG